MCVSLWTCMCVSKRFKHESRQIILSKSKKRKREEGKSPLLKDVRLGYVYIYTYSIHTLYSSGADPCKAVERVVLSTVL